MPSNTYYNAFRSDEARDLHKHPMENHLLKIIADKASRKNQKTSDIVPGQALLGDYKNYGMTERNYRTAKKNLKAWGYATFRGTSQGTVATMCCPEVYDINKLDGDEQDDELPDGRQTDGKRTADGQSTTNKNIKNIKKDKKEDKEADPKDQLFETFWNLYQKKVKRPSAERAFRRLSLETIQEILIHVPEYVQSTPELQFRLHPTTYLNEHKWEDEIIEETEDDCGHPGHTKEEGRRIMNQKPIKPGAKGYAPRIRVF